MRDDLVFDNYRSVMLASFLLLSWGQLPIGSSEEDRVQPQIILPSLVTLVVSVQWSTSPLSLLEVEAHGLGALGVWSLGWEGLLREVNRLIVDCCSPY